MKVDGEVVGALVECSAARYAIIQASSKKNLPERLATAYADANCLRDLIRMGAVLKDRLRNLQQAAVNLRYLQEIASSSPQGSQQVHAEHRRARLQFSRGNDHEPRQGFAGCHYYETPVSDDSHVLRSSAEL
jgi:hypothetical protein